MAQPKANHLLEVVPGQTTIDFGVRWQVGSSRDTVAPVVDASWGVVVKASYDSGLEEAIFRYTEADTSVITFVGDGTVRVTIPSSATVGLRPGTARWDMTLTDPVLHRDTTIAGGRLGIKEPA